MGVAVALALPAEALDPVAAALVVARNPPGLVVGSPLARGTLLARLGCNSVDIYDLGWGFGT